MKSIITLITLVSLVAWMSACGPHEKPNFVYMPDMATSPAVKAQAVGSMRDPVPGTVARGTERYLYPDDPEMAGKMLRNPLRRSKANLYKGRELFNIYCIVCHGAMGEGDGTVVPKFPRPPSLQSEKIRTWSDGRIFHVITRGQNLMPSYASQVRTEERWAIIHYIRALQKAKNPTAEEIKRAESYE